ncbi:MAG: class I SAM-dependent methyltransferase [Pseudomonadota bacterium]
MAKKDRKKGKADKPGKKARKKATLASQADRHVLYEKSVQSPEDEIDLIRQFYANHRKAKPRVLREDFCGTATLTCEWIKASPKHRGIGVDFDREVLDWGRENNVGKLTAKQAERIQLIEADVLAVETDPADILVAFNFSYWTFQTRERMLAYFRQALTSLSDDGLMLLDFYGGPDAFTECVEKTKHEGFTYVWEQANYDPLSGSVDCFIHFHFPDRSKMQPAFSYRWRLWTLPELRDVILEAGFSDITVYWEQADDEGEGTGEYEAVERGEADPAWIVYVVAEP